MSNQPVNYATPTTAIRVFCGFNRPDLNEPQFFAQLGQTFMPGTPYMLQPLGLAAYLPGVVSNPPAGLPHEFALICYPSPAAWRHANSETLRGRVYNQTHGGVYASPPSGASFPILLDELPPTAVDPFFLFSTDIDWQSGFTHVLIGLKKDETQTGNQFRTALRAALAGTATQLKQAGSDQVVAMARDDFAIIWFHSNRAEFPDPIDPVRVLLDNPQSLLHERVICQDEPPTVAINRTQAFNFIFVREPRFFLQ
ncbi:hypothetical protein G8O24_08030 [Bradyrhizobium sp. INPA01-394B]|uniref:Uncharacterized protein n=1 Tax=Bradyrhizobium campsiandrae TaxID=1729892 RepID=A0ABR7UBX2_9BRAD|nr:hypothetical protein [Bradyrhizobium campsiandrae]MBC9877293.1 hypothetical protein [Bradyrhizobium campsiandrae]MBC9981393.1 hypothetical protein [Bradyrhizobium campsiandrae]